MNKMKICPRCGKAFLCMHDAPTLCQCSAIELTKKVRTYLSTHYNDCLCIDCLRALSDSLVDEDTGSHGDVE